MIRGTTPTLTFQLPFACSQITALNIAFAQKNQIVLEKTLRDCSMDGRTITVRLSEEETLRFNSSQVVELQLRLACGETKLASNIMKTTAERILKDGCLV